MNRQSTKCPICGKEIQQKRILRTQKYCSRECAAIVLQKRSESKCAYCGKEISVKPHQEGRKKYCSVACRNNSQILQNGVRRICKICNVEKNIDEFIKTKDRASCRGYICKTCACDKQKERYKQGLCYQKKGRIKSAISKKDRRAIISRKYNTKPDIIIKTREYSKNKKAEWCATLHDLYIKSAIKASSEFKVEEITPELIELKREQITMKRTLKQFKQWREENESDHTDVPGIEHADEINNEGGIQT